MSTTYVPIALRRQVREQAAGCCEYCLIPESMTWALHTIDHIIAEKHGGTTAADNLALACALCNSRKGSDCASVDERTGFIEPLFHPRRDRWSDHFQLAGGRIEPRTAAGRATTRLLRFNDIDRVQERELLVAIGSIRPAYLAQRTD
ncbi:MAG: HNH endonuclease [Isosphaeraceae bacterium]